MSEERHPGQNPSVDVSNIPPNLEPQLGFIGPGEQEQLGPAHGLGMEPIVERGEGESIRPVRRVVEQEFDGQGGVVQGSEKVVKLIYRVDDKQDVEVEVLDNPDVKSFQATAISYGSRTRIRIHPETTEEERRTAFLWLIRELRRVDFEDKLLLWSRPKPEVLEDLGDPIVITEKTLHEWLVAQNWSSDSTPRRKVAEDMKQNAEELTSEVDWYEVWSHVTAEVQKRTVNAVTALAFSVAPTVGRVASALEWDMHSPNVVYMSGYHAVWALGKDIDELNVRAADSNRKFESVAQREEALQREKKTASRLAGFRERISNELTRFSKQNGIDEERQELLRGLLYMGQQKVPPTTQKRILGYVKDGDIAKAISWLPQKPPHNP